MTAKRPLCLLIIIVFAYAVPGMAQCPGFSGSVDFTVNQTSLCAHEDFVFTAKTSPTFKSYRWELGDGKVKQGASIRHQYAPTGSQYTVTVKLVVTDTSGILCETTKSLTIKATPLIEGSLNDKRECLSQTSTIDTFRTTLSLNKIPTSNYTWKWGDGTTQSSNAQKLSHTYKRYGSFPIEVGISNGTCQGYFRDTVAFFRIPSVKIEFPPGEVEICEGIPVKLLNKTDKEDVEYYSWTWENGAKSIQTTTNETPDYKYDFSKLFVCDLQKTQIKVEAYNSCQTHSATIDIFVQPIVRGKIEVTKTQLCINEPLQFTNATCEKNDVNFSWDFGDGTTSTELNPSHTYSKPGIYTVKLITKKPNSKCGTIDGEKQIIVSDIPRLNIELFGNGVLNNSGGCSPLDITFNNNSQPNVGVNYTWSTNTTTGVSFVNNTNKNSEKPAFRIVQAGTYVISLNANNQCGSAKWVDTCIVRSKPTVSINEAKDTCSAFSYLPSATINDNGSPISAYNWTFEGANPSTANVASPGSIAYTSRNQPYIVRLSVENACGVSNDSDTFRVAGLANLQVPKDSALCNNTGPLSLKATPVGGKWQGEGIDPNTGIFTPSKVGNFPLIYSLGTGQCRVQDTVNIRVNPAVAVNINAVDSALCVGDPSITLSANPTGGIWSDGKKNSTSFQPLGAGEQTFVYTYIDSLTKCKSVGKIRIRVSEKPQIQLPSNNVYCVSPSPITLKGYNPLDGNGGSGRWSGPGISDAAKGLFNSGSLGIDTVKLTYIFTSVAGCADTASMEVATIAATPAEAGSNDTLCRNDAIFTLTGFSPLGGRWEGPGIITGTNTFDPQKANIGLNELSYIFGTEDCETVDKKSIFVVGNPGANTGDPINVCEGAGIVTLQGMPAGGIWSGTGILDPVLGTFDPSLLANGATGKLTYTITSAEGCTGSAVLDINKVALPVVDFALPEACINAVANFENLTQGATTYSWNFGDGATSIDASPTHTFTRAGTFLVKLTAASGFGCIDSINKLLTVSDIPQAVFDLSTSEGCAKRINDSLVALEVNIVDLSKANGGNYLWDFGTGLGSVAASPGTMYFPQHTRDTTYIVRLTLKNVCSSSIAERSVKVLPLPQVDIGTNVDEGCSPLKIEFANLTQGKPISFAWNLGNGQFSTDSLPPNQFYLTGNRDTSYTIRLIAENSCGLDTGTQDILVFPNTVKAFYSLDSLQGCPPFRIELTDFSNTPYRVWNFGDGRSGDTVRTVRHVFTQAGNYPISLIAHNGCSFDTLTRLVKVFAAFPSSGRISAPLCQDDTLQMKAIAKAGIGAYSWDLGDGTTRSGIAIDHVYAQAGTYTLRLTTLSDTFQCPSVWDTTLRIGAEPKVYIAPSALSGCQPLKVDFDNSSGGQFFFWDFGDQSNSNLASPSHVYTGPGRYQVRLLLRDLAGCTNDTTTSIEVFERPTAGFGASADEICEGEQIFFSDLSVGTQVNRLWRFGDRTSSQVRNPSQRFLDAGLFRVTQFVSNPFGCTDTAFKDIRVYPQPSADFQIDRSPACMNRPVSFFPLDMRATDWLWDFGDGFFDDSSSPIYTYTNPGVYDVTLHTAYEDKCADTLQKIRAVTVFQAPTSAFEAVFDSVPNGNVIFQDTSVLSGNRVKWILDGQEISSAKRFTYSFERYDTLEVQLISILANGCADTAISFIFPPEFGNLFIPNAFAPLSGAGDAALFKPVGLGLRRFHLAVYNTWGNLLWETRKVDKNGVPSEFWDGKVNGKLMPEDTYVWRLHTAIFEDGRVYQGKSTGSVNLLR